MTEKIRLRFQLNDIRYGVSDILLLTSAIGICLARVKADFFEFDTGHEYDRSML